MALLPRVHSYGPGFPFYRLFYRFKGAPEDRPGGAWWYRDFEWETTALTYLSDLRPFLHAFALECSTDPVPQDDMKIAPPAGVVVTEVE